MAKRGPQQETENWTHDWIVSATALAECKERKAAEAMAAGQFERANTNRRVAEMLRKSIARK